MLKLERSVNDSQVSVIFRDKERVFNSLFLRAFGIALALHIGLVLLFQITPLKIKFSSGPILSTIVEADLNLKEDGFVVANPHLEVTTDPIFENAPQSFPLAAVFPSYLSMRQMEYREEPEQVDNLFTEVEKEVHPRMFSSSLNHSIEPVSLKISGPLSNRKYTLPKKDPSLRLKIPLLVKYEILVEENSGRIFWYERLSGAVDSAVEKMAASFRDEIRFDPNPAAFVTAGQIEFHFNAFPQEIK